MLRQKQQPFEHPTREVLLNLLLSAKARLMFSRAGVDHEDMSALSDGP